MEKRSRINPEQKLQFTAWAVEHREKLTGKTRREVAQLCEALNGFAPSDNVIAQVAAALSLDLKVKPRTESAGQLVADKLAADMEWVGEEFAEIRADLSILARDRDRFNKAVGQLVDEVEDVVKRRGNLEPVAAENGSWRPDHAVDGNGQGGTP